MFLLKRIVCIIILTHSLSFADDIHLKSGKTYTNVETWREGNNVCFEKYGTVIKIPLTDVKNFESKNKKYKYSIDEMIKICGSSRKAIKKLIEKQCFEKSYIQERSTQTDECRAKIITSQSDYEIFYSKTLERINALSKGDAEKAQAYKKQLNDGIGLTKNDIDFWKFYDNSIGDAKNSRWQEFWEAYRAFKAQQQYLKNLKQIKKDIDAQIDKKDI